MQVITRPIAPAHRGPRVHTSLHRSNRKLLDTETPSGASYLIGLFVPTMGVAGIWGPSAIACAELAVEEVNRAGGVRGRELKLQIFNASDECEDMASQTRAAVHECNIDAIVGMHTSSVRRAILEGNQGNVPYIYTALHEGTDSAHRLYTIGETPERQLRPVIDWFAAKRNTRRWMFVGNDYEWPRVSHALAQKYVFDAGGQVLADCYVPFGKLDIDALLEKIEEVKPDALLLSLVGQDAVDFNRAFGAAKMHSKMIRLSCSVEENILLAIGAANTRDLFVPSGYFSALSDDVNSGFKERYHKRFGVRAPTLNSLGQSTYEGIYFAASLALRTQWQPSTADGSFGGVRGIVWHSNNALQYPVHLAQADGHFFKVIHSF